jgi:hypothetical protein
MNLHKLTDVSSTSFGSGQTTPAPFGCHGIAPHVRAAAVYLATMMSSARLLMCASCTGSGSEIPVTDIHIRHGGQSFTTPSRFGFPSLEYRHSFGFHSAAADPHLVESSGPPTAAAPVGLPRCSLTHPAPTEGRDVVQHVTSSSFATPAKIPQCVSTCLQPTMPQSP